MRREIYRPEFAPTSALPIIFGFSENYFLGKKDDGILREKVHYFYPTEKNPNSKSNKRAMTWDLEALRNWIRGEEVDAELEELLNRKVG